MGLAPADRNLPLHAFGALLQVPGAVGMLLVGLAARRQCGWISTFGLVCGAVVTTASVLFLAGTHLGLGSVAWNAEGAVSPRVRVGLLAVGAVRALCRRVWSRELANG